MGCVVHERHAESLGLDWLLCIGASSAFAFPIAWWGVVAFAGLVVAWGIHFRLGFAGCVLAWLVLLAVSGSDDVGSNLVECSLPASTGARQSFGID